MKTALIAGATGLVGQALVKELLNRNTYEKLILPARRETPFRNEPRVEEIVLSFDDLEDAELYADDIYICLGTTIKKAGTKEAFEKVDYTYPLTLAKQALKQGAAQLAVISAIGADQESNFFYSRVKGNLEESLIMLGYPSLHILRPSLLTGPRGEFRFGEKTAEVITKPLQFAMIGPLEKYRPVHADDVAAVMHAVCQEQSSGVHIYQSDQIRHLAEVVKEKTELLTENQEEENQ
ncbi:NAD-dependent epimerase/dehydratase family protein [Alteribacter natronophilus]|uniref:NAD-dependent epimerase/dehydratase family protein n=1 Tax=Alteribacter natronophilus TaxID=2583810 RepID=UPI001AEE06EE|nr:NAD-dependent epimerase/dehydratase family protein [Alteribacter natronophilus]